MRFINNHRLPSYFVVLCDPDHLSLQYRSARATGIARESQLSDFGALIADKATNVTANA